MIILEIILFLVLLGAGVYFAFFSKRAQKIASSAERRNRNLHSCNSTEAVIARLDQADKDFAAAADEFEARRKALAEEQTRLDKLSSK